MGLKLKLVLCRFSVPVFFSFFVQVDAAVALDSSMNLGLAYRKYTQSAIFENQTDGGFSVRAQAEVREKWNDDSTVLTFLPFYRYDDLDGERSHGDIRQFDLVHSSGDWEYQAGIGKVFWGVAESAHLVDVINQTDGVESLDGEDKLGQPMVKIGRFVNDGLISLYIMPYFRERTFPGEEGRLRFFSPIDTNSAQYESPQKERHVDYALRMQKSVDSVDIGLSYFDGTSRAPIILFEETSERLFPYYNQVEQTGVDAQYTGEKWVWKLEAIYREYLDTSYHAQVGGFEYTIPGFLETNIELGLIAEYHHDSRGDILDAPFQDDVFLGSRWVFNDFDADCLIGGYSDLHNGSKSFLIEFALRLSNQVQLNVEAQAFSDVDQNDSFYDFRNDDFIEIEFNYFF